MSDNKQKINLADNKVVIVKDNKKVEELQAPDSGHGFHKVVWVDGKVVRVECSSSKKI